MLLNIKAKESFSRLTPEGAFGDRIARGLVGATTGTLPAFSPFVHKVGLNAASTLPKLSRPLGPVMGQLASGPVQPERTPSGAYTKDFEQKLINQRRR